MNCRRHLPPAPTIARQSLVALILLAYVLGIQGCGEPEAARSLNAPAPASAVAAPNGIARYGGMMGGAMAGRGSFASKRSGEGVDAKPAEDGQEPAAPTEVIPDGPVANVADEPARLPPKIIYNAQLTLVVESISDFDKKLGELIKQTGGYISETNQTSATGAQRGASWTVRVPVVKFDDLFTTVGRMGELQQSHLDTEDVSMEYYDIEARITNKQQEEKRLVKHLADSTGNLKDILAVERELSRVRGEIEQMQGRIRYLSNVTAFSTVTINATELIDYKPPVRPTFGIQIGRTFRESIENLGGFIKELVLVSVAIAPWLPVLFVIVLPLLWSLRRWRARRTPPVA